jgi:hypothetical protein
VRPSGLLFPKFLVSFPEIAKPLKRIAEGDHQYCRNKKYDKRMAGDFGGPFRE